MASSPLGTNLVDKDSSSNNQQGAAAAAASYGFEVEANNNATMQAHNSDEGQASLKKKLKKRKNREKSSLSEKKRNRKSKDKRERKDIGCSSTQKPEAVHLKDKTHLMLHENYEQVLDSLIVPDTDDEDIIARRPIIRKINVKIANVQDKDSKKAKVKKCHHCSEKNNLVHCESCQRSRYCSSCVMNWYPRLLDGNKMDACPSCLGNCSNKKCLRNTDLIMDIKDLGVPPTGKVKLQRLKYLIAQLYPFLRDFEKIQSAEKKLEAKNKKSKLVVPKAKFDPNDRLYCNKCNTSIADLHRACSSECAFDVCLACCAQMREQQGRKVDIYCDKKHRKRRILKLKSMYESDWVSNLASKVEELVKAYKLEAVASPCFKLVKTVDAVHQQRKASRREDTCDNYLYCPSADELQDFELGNFLSHWKKGEPVIVTGAYESSSSLSWDPRVLSRGILQDEQNLITAVNCSDHLEKQISWQQFAQGYLEGSFNEDSQPKILKVKDWPTNTTVDSLLPRHCAEFVNALPYPEFTNPYSGFLNIATKFPSDCLKPDLGPKTFMAYGLCRELEHGDSVTKLHCDVSDAVNILMHVSEWKEPDELVGSFDLGLAHSFDSASGGALWDIFRREDVPKLEKYLRKHHSEFYHYFGERVEEVDHPIHDQCFYINMDHKKKLKEECGIEPWTFVQSLGEAVLIPAGCPHQVRNIRPCVKAAMDFVSAENVAQCIQLTEEYRVLQLEDKLGVKKMILHALEYAALELEKLMMSE